MFKEISVGILCAPPLLQSLNIFKKCLLQDEQDVLRFFFSPFSRSRDRKVGLELKNILNGKQGVLRCL